MCDKLEELTLANGIVTSLSHDKLSYTFIHRVCSYVHSTCFTDYIEAHLPATTKLRYEVSCCYIRHLHRKDVAGGMVPSALRACNA